MRILIDICHPAQAHFFRNPIRILLKRGHQILIVAREKDVTLDLLKSWNYPHCSTPKMGKRLIDFFREFITRNAKIYSLALRFKPDIIIAHNDGIFTIFPAKLLQIPILLFDDTECAVFYTPIARFATRVCTPLFYQQNLGKNHFRYNGFKELSSLHPNHFIPDKDVLKENFLELGEKFFVLRFVSNEAIHDVTLGLISSDDTLKKQLVEYLENFGKVLISTEKEAPWMTKANLILSGPEKFHSLLYFASLVFSDGGTVVTEAGLLGTPAIRCSKSVGLKIGKGVFDEMEKKYSLVFSIKDFKQAFEKVKELVQQKDLKEEWDRRRKRLIQDKLDVADFVVNLAESLAT